jgi:dTMP kinase
MSGFFITFEGGEGSGKTTQVNKLATALTAKGHKVVTTREPGGTKQADAIRALLVQNDSGNWPPFAELCLVSAARMVHIRDVIQPALDEGKIVLCDRFIHSTIAYQGAGRGLDQELIDTMIRESAGTARPDLTLFFDIDVKAGLERTKRREVAQSLDGDVLEDKFESLNVDFHERVRQGFLKFEGDDNFVKIDAARDIETIAAEVLEIVENKTK